MIQFGSPTYNWSSHAIGAGAGAFDTLVRPTAHFTPSAPGLLVLVLTYVQRDLTHAAPYTFEIRLKPALDVPATIIPKAQYDIIMNVLDAFRPIGVEVRTDQIRKHVREIEQIELGVPRVQLSQFPLLTGSGIGRYVLKSNALN